MTNTLTTQKALQALKDGFTLNYNGRLYKMRGEALFYKDEGERVWKESFATPEAIANVEGFSLHQEITARIAQLEEEIAELTEGITQVQGFICVDVLVKARGERQRELEKLKA